MIEVTLATGIVSFAFLVIVSMMPVGLSTLQTASRQSVESQIFDKMAAELNAVPFTTLTTYVQPVTGPRFPVYFDNEGLEVAAANAVYTVQCAVVVPDPNAPPNPDLVAVSKELQAVQVKIGYHADPAATAPAPSAAQVSKRAMLLVNRSGAAGQS